MDKRVGGVENGNEGEYITSTYKFLLFPQKDGKFNLDNFFVNVGILQRTRMGGFLNDPFFDNFNTTIKYKKIYAKKLILNVNPLPNYHRHP